MEFDRDWWRLGENGPRNWIGLGKLWKVTPNLIEDWRGDTENRYRPGSSVNGVDSTWPIESASSALIEFEVASYSTHLNKAAHPPKN